MRWFYPLILLVMLPLTLLSQAALAQETDTQALMRRLAELEAEVAQLKQPRVKPPRRDAAWTAPALSGTVEQVNGELVPPPPGPSRDEISDLLSQAEPETLSDLERLLVKQSAELERQSHEIAMLQSQTGTRAVGPTNISTVQGSVFGPDAVDSTGKFLSDGLTFTSKDGNFKSHIGGVVQLDAIGYGAISHGVVGIPGGAGTQNSVEFRRLRIRMEGTMYKNIDYVFESDFALALQNTDQLSSAQSLSGLRSFPTGVGVQGGNVTNGMFPTTIFMTFKEVPILGNVRVGNQQNWISMDHIESARFLDFMERAPIMDAFSGPNNNGYAPGASFFSNSENMVLGWQAGIYKNNVYDSGFTYSIGNAWIYGGRLIMTPYYDEESKGRNLVHLGIGSEYRTYNQKVGAAQGFDNIRIRSRGDLRNAAAVLDPNYSDTGNFYAGSQTLLNPEIAIQLGSLLLQAEYSASFINGAKPAANINVNLDQVFMQGGYVEALYFLTGEHRNYNRQSGVFGRVVPTDNLDLSKCTYGAWQAGVRYDWLNLNSGAFVNGGKNQDITFGLNWFLNPNARFQVNYVMSWVNNAPSTTFPGSLGALNGSRFVGDGMINSFGGRMDFTF